MSFDRKKEAGLPATVVSAETMLSVIETLGIVPFFENPIPGYSIEEMTARENWFDGQEDLRKTPWDWKIPVVQSGDVAYGKFLWGGKAAFATVEWYAELMNWRRSLEKYQPTAEQRLVMDYLAEHGSIGIKEIRALLGVKKSAADALMTRLQMQCRVVTGDITRVYRGPDLHYNGWQVDDAPADAVPRGHRRHHARLPRPRPPLQRLAGLLLLHTGIPLLCRCHPRPRRLPLRRSPHPGRGPLPCRIAGAAGGAYPGNRARGLREADPEDAAIARQENEKTSF